MVLTNNNATALGRHLTVARNRSRATISKRGRKLGSIEISRSLRGLAPFQEAINEVTGRAGFGWLSFFKNLANWIEGDRQPPNDLAKKQCGNFLLFASRTRRISGIVSARAIVLFGWRRRGSRERINYNGLLSTRKAASMQNKSSRITPPMKVERKRDSIST